MCLLGLRKTGFHNYNQILILTECLNHQRELHHIYWFFFVVGFCFWVKHCIRTQCSDMIERLTYSAKGHGWEAFRIAVELFTQTSCLSQNLSMISKGLWDLLQNGPKDHMFQDTAAPVSPPTSNSPLEIRDWDTHLNMARILGRKDQTITGKKNPCGKNCTHSDSNLVQFTLPLRRSHR